MNSHTTKTIDEVVEALIDYRGKTPPKTTNGIKLITAKVVKDGFIQDGNHEYISENIYDGWMRRGLPKQWDILITTEAPLGEVAQLRTTEKIALAQRIILLRGNSSIIDQQYFFQCLKSPFFQGNLKARSTGTTVLGVKQSELRQVEIPYFPLPIQRKIASILSAYDDLIENNTRRIEILEEMARMIYQEWFVKFRFPGHKKVKLIHSPLGKIPEGWKVKHLKAELEVTRGLSYKGEYLASSGTPMHNLNSILEGGGYKYSGIKFYSGPYNDGKEVVPGDVIVANTEQTWDRQLLGCVATVPRRFGSKGIFSHHLYRVRPAPKSYLSKPFIFLMLDEEGLRDWISRFGNGTTIHMLPKEALSMPRVAIPPERFVKSFTDCVTPIISLIEILHEKNTNLRKTRDLLLPKLISGEVDVSELDITVPEEVAA